MALGLAAHVGDITRFPRPRSLANYWGLTPSCRNSGEKNQRLGFISKEGSNLAWFLLGQLVMHVLKHDGRLRAWYLGIKRRRGAKIARAAYREFGKHSGHPAQLNFGDCFVQHIFLCRRELRQSLAVFLATFCH